MTNPFRDAFTEQFTPERYAALLNQIGTEYPNQLDFRVAETPVFVSNEFKNKLSAACSHIVDTITAAGFVERTEAAIPPGQYVPNQDRHSTFMAVDFGVCRNTNPADPAYGELEPQLIELQGFPSLYGFQAYLADLFRAQYTLSDQLSHLVDVADNEAYISLLREVIVGDCDPEEVILLEIFPEKQKTRIDFALTTHLLGVEAVCLTKIRKQGRELFYEKEGRQVRIRRIYNRLIFDELQAIPNLTTEFNLTDEVDVTWVGHPNWFFRLSKYTLPLIDSPFVPESFYLDQLTNVPENLGDYVLKPLFSFAGSGVKINVTPADIEALPIPERSNYLLQRKVQYEPIIQTYKGPDDRVKCEIRLLFIWPEHEERPRLVTNLARLSRGEMIGVRFNKDYDWVGGTIAFFEK